MSILSTTIPNLNEVPGTGAVTGEALLLVNIDGEDLRLPVERLPGSGAVVRVTETEFLARYADGQLGIYVDKAVRITDRAAGDGEVHLPAVMTQQGIQYDDAYLLPDAESPAIPVSYNANDGTTSPRGGGSIDESNLAKLDTGSTTGNIFQQRLTVTDNAGTYTRVGADGFYAIGSDSSDMELTADHLSINEAGSSSSATLRGDRLLVGGSTYLYDPNAGTVTLSGASFRLGYTPSAAADVDTVGARDAAIGAAVYGLSYKDEVRLRLLSIPGGGTLATAGLPTVQGVQIAAGDRIMLALGTAESGIYIASAGTWVRSEDTNTSARMRRATAFVLEGTYAQDANGNLRSYTATFGMSSTLGTTAFTFAENYNLQYAAGTGLTLTGGTFAIALSAAFAWTGTHTFSAKVTMTGGLQLGASGATATASRDSYAIADNTTVTGYIINGTYTNGELQSSSANYAAAIAASAAGDEFTTTVYGYRYQRKADGTLGWCRYPKG